MVCWVLASGNCELSSEEGVKLTLFPTVPQHEKRNLSERNGGVKFSFT